MSENLPNIDDLFRKALESHDDMPSTDVWANIDKNLDKKKVVSIAKKYRKLKWVAAALLIFSVGMAMYTVHTRLRNKELVEQNEINRKKVVKIPGPSNRGYLTDTSNPTLAGAATKEKTKNEIPAATDTNSSISSAIAKNRQSTGNKTSDALKNEEILRSNKRIQEVGKDKKVKWLANLSEAGASASQKDPFFGEDQMKNNSVATLKDNVVVNADQTFEQVKRDIEVATVGQDEKLLEIAPPVLILAPQPSNMLAVNNIETIENKSTAGKKLAVKLNFASRISATAFYSPDFVSTRVHNDRPHFREDDRDEIKNKEKISQASTTGILINYSIGNSWNLQSGVVFSTLTTDILPKTIFARPDNRGNINYRFNCSAGYTYVALKSAATTPVAGDSILALSSRNTLKYFEIPIGISYRISGGRFSVSPGAGITANFLTSGSIETSLPGQGGAENKRSDQIEGINSSYMNSSLSLAANYYFTNNLALTFTPVARIALSAINKDGPVKTYLNSYGLSAGLTVRF